MTYVLALLILSTPPTAECKEGRRDDPAVVVTHDGRQHWVYFQKHEHGTCTSYARRFVDENLPRVCGCKTLKYPGKKDRLGLKCANRVDDKIISKYVAIYYYTESIRACNRLRDILMFKNK